MKVLIIFGCAIAFVAGKAADPNAALPSTLKVCNLNDPGRDECIKTSMQAFLPSLRKEIQNLSLPPIDPFSFNSMTFSFKNSGSFAGTFNLRSVTTYGMSRTKVQSVKSDFTNDIMKIQAEVFFPKLFSSGNYKSNMTLNSLKLDAKGQFNLTMKDVKAKLRIKGKLEKEDDGELYMKVSRFDIIPEPNDIHISVSGLFPDENLNKAANEFLNQSWRTYYKEIIPGTRKQWEPILRELVNQFFTQIPFRRLQIQV